MSAPTKETTAKLRDLLKAYNSAGERVERHVATLAAVHENIKKAETDRNEAGTKIRLALHDMNFDNVLRSNQDETLIWLLAELVTPSPIPPLPPAPSFSSAPPPPPALPPMPKTDTGGYHG